MKKYIKYVIIAILSIILISIIIISNANRDKDKNEENKKFKIVTSFYPIYIMTLNVTQGANNVELVNMADTNIGCIHDYNLNTEDMKKIENADVFVQNGLGLESFIDKIINSNPELFIIDSSHGIKDVVKDNENINPHIWTSISKYIEQVENISEGLSKANPENSETYRANAKGYITRLENIKAKYNNELISLCGQGAIILNESFEYLANDLNMNKITIHTDHEESVMSAEVLKDTIEHIRENDIKLIIIDINDDEKNAQTIAKETGAKVYELDSSIVGSMNKNTYINSMNGNLEILKEAIK